MLKKPEQLSLFDYQPSAKIVHLPVSIWGRTEWMRWAECAIRVMIDKPEMEETYWASLNRQIFLALQKCGISESDIASETLKARQYVAQQVAIIRHDQRRRA